ncbi:MAG: TraR/DksA C4-type zinc finger protein [Candidatus Moranbacteria bacterium]|nr:TraR/DksA C4-type zinc finger protein [Candidatus Moranbacteria bacterium]
MAIDPQIQTELKEKLLKEKNRLENELKNFAAPTEVPGDYKTKFSDLGTDVDENASEVEEYTDNLALESTLEKRLKDVGDALARMEEGTYGTCGNCGQEINIERLRAYPAAKTCIRCK